MPIALGSERNNDKSHPSSGGFAVSRSKDEMPTKRYPNGEEMSKAEVYTTPRPNGTRGESVVHRQRHSARSFALDELDADELHHVLKTVARHGDCCCFTLTSDGGALCTTVVQGSVRHKVYARTPEDALDQWHGLLEALY